MSAFLKERGDVFTAAVGRLPSAMIGLSTNHAVRRTAGWPARFDMDMPACWSRHRGLLGPGVGHGVHLASMEVAAANWASPLF